MRILLLIFIWMNTIMVIGQKRVYISQSTGVVDNVLLSEMDSMVVDTESFLVRFYAQGYMKEYPVWQIDSLFFKQDSDTDKKIRIVYSGDAVEVDNPLAFQGVTVTANGAHVVINSILDEEIEYLLSGNTDNGSFKIYSDKKFILSLNGISITSSDGPAINIQSGKKTTVNLSDNTSNQLIDGYEYTSYGNEDMKAAFFSEGQLVFQGNGNLAVTGNYKHGICSDDYILVESGNIQVINALSDAIHVNDYFQQEGGSITLAASSDGIDVEKGYFAMNGGELNITIPGDGYKGIKCSDYLIVNGGNITITTSGNVEVENNDPSYCTAIKSKSDITINGGTIQITSTGTAGKGISADNDFYITGGNLHITTSGNGGIYTNTSNQRDSYSANCLKSNGNMEITGGTITTHSSGTAGKGISVDGTLTIGGINEYPILNITTTGSKITISSGGGGGMGGGFNSGNYANPKAVKSIGNMNVNGGTFTIRTSQDGGEGLESKAILTINDGSFDIQTYDDAINASTHIQINGGEMYFYSSGNDGVDSNGTLTITGGTILAIGTDSPEAGLDCDNSTFKITGGTIVGVGGSTSTPTSNVCTQRTIIYSGTGSANELINIRSGNGKDIFTFKLPRSYSRQMVLVVSTPDIEANTSYTLYKGGSISGGTEFYGLYIDGDYTAGTTTSTFTTSSSSMITTVGSSGGGGGGGGFRP